MIDYYEGQIQLVGGGVGQHALERAFSTRFVEVPIANHIKGTRCASSSVASSLVGGGGGGSKTPNVLMGKRFTTCNLYARASEASKSSEIYLLHLQFSLIPFIIYTWYGAINDSIPTKHYH